jgi:hypothetical protein
MIFENERQGSRINTTMCDSPSMWLFVMIFFLKKRPLINATIRITKTALKTGKKYMPKFMMLNFRVFAIDSF